jgi:hypothetical protein
LIRIFGREQNLESLENEAEVLKAQSKSSVRMIPYLFKRYLVPYIFRDTLDILSFVSQLTEKREKILACACRLILKYGATQ